MKPLWPYLFSAILFLMILVGQTRVQAAACCGGGFATPSLISGDQKSQFTASYSLVEVSVDSVDSRGIWSKWDEHQKVQTLKLDAAYLLSDRLQMGVSIPVIQRSRMQDHYTGLGDVSVSLGYEWLTDWDYNPYRPKGILFMQVIAPTGKSKVDSEVGGLDSRGNGFWALGAGTLFTKTFYLWDAFVTTEVHRSWSKTISNKMFEGVARPGMGGSFGLGLGYSIQSWRLGGSLTWMYEDGIEMRGSTVTTDGPLERFATALMSLSYMASDDWAYTLSYSDQTLFGSPINTSLGRGLVFLIQKRTLR